MRPAHVSQRATAAALIFGPISLLAAGCGLVGNNDGQSASTSTTPQASPQPSVPPEEVLERYVERRLFQGFVDDCDEADRPDDVGKQCARYLGTRDGLVAYALGPTFAPYTRLIILEPASDTWTIVHLERRDPNDPPVPGVPWPLRVGATVVVAGLESCLQARERPGVQAPPVTCLENGTVATITQGPVEIDHFQWWHLEGYGWSASNWLRYPEEVQPAPEPTGTQEA